MPVAGPNWALRASKRGTDNRIPIRAVRLAAVILTPSGFICILMKQGAADPMTPAVKVGDHIQWEQGGVLQLPQASRVVWVSGDGRWLRIEGNPTGIPTEEAHIVEPPPPPMDLFQSEMNHLMGTIGPGPLAQRLKVMMTGTSRLRVNADLVHPGEVDKLIRILVANKALLEDDINAKESNADVPAPAASDE